MVTHNSKSDLPLCIYNVFSACKNVQLMRMSVKCCLVRPSHYWVFNIYPTDFDRSYHMFDAHGGRCAAQDGAAEAMWKMKKHPLAHPHRYKTNNFRFHASER